MKKTNSSFNYELFSFNFLTFLFKTQIPLEAKQIKSSPQMPDYKSEVTFGKRKVREAEAKHLQKSMINYHQQFLSQMKHLSVPEIDYKNKTRPIIREVFYPKNSNPKKIIDLYRDMYGVSIPFFSQTKPGLSKRKMKKILSKRFIYLNQTPEEMYNMYINNYKQVWEDSEKYREKETSPSFKEEDLIKNEKYCNYLGIVFFFKEYIKTDPPGDKEIVFNDLLRKIHDSLGEDFITFFNKVSYKKYRDEQPGEFDTNSNEKTISTYLSTGSTRITNATIYNGQTKKKARKYKRRIKKRGVVHFQNSYLNQINILPEMRENNNIEETHAPVKVSRKKRRRGESKAQRGTDEYYCREMKIQNNKEVLFTLSNFMQFFRCYGNKSILHAVGDYQTMTVSQRLHVKALGSVTYKSFEFKKQLVSGRVIEVFLFRIQPKHAGKGAGSALVKKLKKMTNAKLILWSEDNEETLRIYDKMGFISCQFHKKYISAKYTNFVDNAVFMHTRGFCPYCKDEIMASHVT